MKQKLFWTLNVILNSARFMVVLAILEKATGCFLDWPNGTEAWPVIKKEPSGYLNDQPLWRVGSAKLKVRTFWFFTKEKAANQ